MVSPEVWRDWSRTDFGNVGGKHIEAYGTWSGLGRIREIRVRSSEDHETCLGVHSVHRIRYSTIPNSRNPIQNLSPTIVKTVRGSLFPGEFQNFERMPILTNGSLIENPITRIGENDVRMIPRPWESRDQVLSKVPSIRKLGNFGVGFGELFSKSSVSKFYLSLTNCTIFVPASNNFPGSQIISIELLCVYRAKYPPSPQTCSNVTWIRNVTLLRLLEKRASFSTLPCSIARHLYRSLGFIALNCRVTCDWRMESRGPRSIFFTVLKRSWRWYLQRGRDIGSTISKGDCEPLRKPRVI